MRRSVTVAATAAALVLFLAAPAAAATPWTIVPTPPATDSSLNSISCTSASSCEAVGTMQGPNGGIPLAEHWDGASWTIQDTPAAGSIASWLTGVSCISPARCVAVGAELFPGFEVAPIAWTWDGSTWAIQTMPIPSGAYSVPLSSISCTSAARCEAVGYYETLSGGDALHTLAEAWDGSTWAIQPTPNFSALNILAAVSCVSAARCTAVGYGSRVPGGLLAETWNGLRWVFQKVPLPSPEAGRLYGVSCTSAVSCTAVGQIWGSAGIPGPLAEHWNGTTWALQAIPGGLSIPNSPAPGLAGISCTSPVSCTAVGSYETKNSTTVAQADVYFRGTWRNQATAAPASSKGLSGVFCFTATACTAVGFGGQSGALVEQK
jgi:hypothetical protein